MNRTKLFLLTAAALALASAAVATTSQVPPLITQAAMGAAPSTSSPMRVTTTSAAYFVPVGYNRLTCTSPTYYSVESASTGTALTTDALAPGPLNVNGISITRSVWVNITSSQWLALLLKSGVDGYCIVEQGSVDGVTGSFTTLAASSTLAVTGASTFGSTATISGAVTTGSSIDAGSLSVIGASSHVGAATFGSTADVTGAVTAASLTLPSSTALAGIKWGTMTMNGASPSVGTATVLSGQKCVCTPVTNAADGATKCAVSSTTLTATGPNSSSGDVNFFCFK